MPKHILVVDDDPNIRRVLREIFIRLGHKITEVAHGLEAVNITQHERFLT